MKIELHLHTVDVASEAFEVFADKHQLTMEVRERGRKFDGSDMQFYARFKGAEVREAGYASNIGGDGLTVESAIEDYRRSLRGKLLVFNSKEIQCPNEWLPEEA